MNQHHITVTISRSRFTENIRLLREFVAPAKLCVVMKADAYGHGSVHLAERAVRSGAEFR